MAAPTFDLVVNQGATYTQQFIYYQPDGVTPVDLTGCYVHLQIRDGHETSPIYIELDNNTFGGIALNPTLGQVNVTITEAQTQTLEQLLYQYDIKIQFPSDTSAVRLVQGHVRVSPNITQ